MIIFCVGAEFSTWPLCGNEGYSISAFSMDTTVAGDLDKNCCRIHWFWNLTSFGINNQDMDISVDFDHSFFKTVVRFIFRDGNFFFFLLKFLSIQ